MESILFVEQSFIDERLNAIGFTESLEHTFKIEIKNMVINHKLKISSSNSEDLTLFQNKAVIFLLFDFYH
jgi:hypothetical protein